MSVRSLLTCGASALVLLTGCPGGANDLLPSCTVPDDLEVNTVVGTVDGIAWSGTTNGFSAIAGPSIQVSATGANQDGAQVNVVLRIRTSTVFSVAEDGETVLEEEGENIQDLLDSDGFPADFAVGDATDDGANGTVVYPPGGAVSTGEGDGGGFLHIASWAVPADGEDGDPKELTGCFAMQAEAQDGTDSAEVVEGGFRLLGM